MLNLISFAKPGSLISFPLVCRESVEGGGDGGFFPDAFLKGSLTTTFQPVEYQHDFKEREWHSAESTRLPPMWPRFKSWRRLHMWVEFVVGSLPCFERFFSGYSGFPLSLKIPIRSGTHGQITGAPKF